MSATYTKIKKLNTRHLHYTGSKLLGYLFYLISSTFSGKQIEVPRIKQFHLVLAGSSEFLWTYASWICSFLPFWRWSSLPLLYCCKYSLYVCGEMVGWRLVISVHGLWTQRNHICSCEKTALHHLSFCDVLHSPYLLTPHLLSTILHHTWHSKGCTYGLYQSGFLPFCLLAVFS